MTRVDSHLHVGFEGFGPKELITYLDRGGFDRCWLLSWEEVDPGAWPYEHLRPESIFEIWQRFPDRIVPMYAPDPHRVDAGQRLADWCSRGFLGCAELKTTLNWESSEVNNLLETVAELRIPVVFHMQALRRHVEPFPDDGPIEKILAKMMRTRQFGYLPHKLVNQITERVAPMKRWRDRRSYLLSYLLDFASLGETLEKFPGVAFVAHGPMWWQHLEDGADSEAPVYPKGSVRAEGLACRFLERYPNLFADISGRSGFNALHRDQDFAKRFLEKFNGKILFGTDNDVCGHAEFIDSLGMGKEVKKRIFGLNSRDVLEFSG